MAAVPCVEAAQGSREKEKENGMKIFDRYGKVNFVDDNNVMLGYDTNQQCCESAGWFVADKPKNVIEEPLYNASDAALYGFQFDPTFFQEMEIPISCGEGGIAIFKIVNEHREIYLHLYNQHNGYYSHGFEFTKPTTIKKGSL